jgi:hypothetical protein
VTVSPGSEKCPEHSKDLLHCPLQTLYYSNKAGNPQFFSFLVKSRQLSIFTIVNTSGRKQGGNKARGEETYSG